ncbi:hypothetical protein P152DRAFT_455032 [Eremomyces bilateralis CBS 781.70]|uniref:Uncharacterized protein n=1 Tax=Eremomyces bilateralis CBS 781.70 TaxID=1392243 RepID=A0A6G1GBG0_9PEZI|nr:uncharacterized protein P152DRAFT_455032 [Eremomyces bilateralis CBS 781.70]KAF1815312.1 hypothetical protein P152DRAFT_455032 [Eremomyces bilateralis CBS 781.70]
MSQEDAKKDPTEVMERTESEESPVPSSKERTKQRTKESTKTSRALQRQKQAYDDDEDSELEEFLAPPPRKNRRMIPVHQSRISDRPIKKGAEDSSLKIKIELDLEVELELYARVKGDVTIGLL